MLGFRYVCERHQRLFVATLTSHGCRDPEKMEEVRRRLLAWLSEKFPRLVLDQFNAERCLGCALEDARLASDARQAVQEITRAVLAEGAPVRM